MRTANLIRLFFLALLILWVASMFVPAALASGDHGKCNHPRFLEHDCGYEGEDGADGQDGADGKDGRDGVDGLNGIDGKDGVVPTKWITETRKFHTSVNRWYEAARDVAAATAAMQVHLPQDQTSRVTFGMSRVDGTTGIGAGYAYMMDDERNTAFTVSIGHAGDATAVRGSLGFEFGGAQRMDIPKYVPEPVPTGSVVIAEDEYDALLMAQVQSDEFDEQKKLIEDRFNQYDNLIHAQQEEINYQREELAKIPDDQEELERLKREEAEDAARRERVRKIYAEGDDG